MLKPFLLATTAILLATGTMAQTKYPPCSRVMRCCRP